MVQPLIPCIRGLFRNYLDNFSYSHMKNRYILKKTRIHLIKVQIFKSMTSLNHCKLTNLHLSNDLEQPQNNRNTILTRFVAPLLWTPLKKRTENIFKFLFLILNSNFWSQHLHITCISNLYFCEQNWSY